MSNVHIATAAHEVASALPSTATVTVSKHGISAIETLNLEAQTASQTHLMWSRTFSGMEIVTNPVLHYVGCRRKSQPIRNQPCSKSYPYHYCQPEAGLPASPATPSPTPRPTLASPSTTPS